MVYKNDDSEFNKIKKVFLKICRYFANEDMKDWVTNGNQMNTHIYMSYIKYFK